MNVALSKAPIQIGRHALIAGGENGLETDDGGHVVV